MLASFLHMMRISKTLCMYRSFNEVAVQQPKAKANYEAEEEAHMYSSQVLWPS